MSVRKPKLASMSKCLSPCRARVKRGELSLEPRERTVSILKDMETPRTISIAEDDIISQQILKTFLAADGYTLEFVDEVGHIRVANQAFRLMLGWRDDQSLIGQSVIGLVARGKRDAFAREIAPLTQKDAEPVSLETVFEPPGSEPFAAEITAGYFEWDTAPSVEILVRDVTEKKRLQSQFLRMQRLQSVGTLAGGIAHDLKNSLTPILLAVHMARAAVKEGPEAVALFARQPAEVMLALIDFRMPVLDGVTTARAMRYLRQDARIILLSEVDEKEEMLMASNGLRLGRLVKPFSVEALLRKTAEGLASSV